MEDIVRRMPSVQPLNISVDDAIVNQLKEKKAQLETFNREKNDIIREFRKKLWL